MLLWLTWALAQEPAAPLRLDAGGLVTPLHGEFSRLHPDGCDDARVTWVDTPGTPQWAGIPDALAGDGLVGGTLHLSLAPGRWDFRVLVGEPAEAPRAWAGTAPIVVTADGVAVLTDTPPPSWEAFVASPWFAANPRPVFLPDETAWSRTVPFTLPWRQVTVDVDSDGVDLAVTGRPLLGLVAWPTASERSAEAEVDLALIDAARAGWWPRHLVPGAAMPAPSVDGPLRVQVAAVDAWPSADAATDAPVLVETLARADRRSVLLVLHGGDAGGAVRVEGSPEVEIDVAEVSWLDSAQHGERAVIPRPTVVWPGPRWEGGQRLPPVLRVRLRTRAGAAPGVHRAAVHLTRDDGATLRVPVQVTVLPVTLDGGIPTGLFAQAPAEVVPRTAPASDTLLALLDDHLRLMADLGFRAVSLRYTWWPAQHGPEAPLDTAVLTHAATTWAGLGGELLEWADPKVPLRPAAYGRPDGPVLPDALVEPTRRRLEAARLAPVPVWIRSWEEEGGWKRAGAAPRGVALATALRAIVPGPIRLTGTTPSPADWPAAAGLDAAMVAGEHAQVQQALAHVRAHGAQGWAYNLAPGGSGPLLAWALGVSAHLQWHAGSELSDPFDATHRGRAFLTVLGPDGRYHATLLVEDMADGLAEARLLATLASRDRTAHTSLLLDAARQALLQAHGTPGTEGALLDRAARDDLRRAALARLARLRAGR